MGYQDAGAVNEKNVQVAASSTRLRDYCKLSSHQFVDLPFRLEASQDWGVGFQLEHMATLDDAATDEEADNEQQRRKHTPSS